MSMIRFDLHVHYKRHARDEVGYEEAMVKAAINAGLDCICFTEHHQQLPPERIAELREQYPSIGIFSGVEISTGNDVLVYGLRCQELTKPMPYPELHALVRANKGAMVIAHPFRKGKPLQVDVEKYPPDGIEVCSRNTPPEKSRDIILLAKRLEIGLFVNSDAHRARHLGPYWNNAGEVPEDERGLAQMVREEFFTV